MQSDTVKMMWRESVLEMEMLTVGGVLGDCEDLHSAVAGESAGPKTGAQSPLAMGLAVSTC